jgi:metallo-beta-lactamase class B
MKPHVFRIICLLGLAVMSQATAAAQTNSALLSAKERNDAENAALRKEWESWNAPFKPFRIIGNIFYVGPSGVSSFLITTPVGHILIDTGFEITVPRIRESVARLGLKLADIKIILNTHAHLDHAGGDALMKKLTGAKIMMSEADASLLASGGTNDFTPYSREMISYPPAHADQILHDGDVVSLGGADLRCHLTPGHTKGCTTWTMDVEDAGKVYHVLFFGSTSVLPGVQLANNPKYPNMVEDFTDTFRKLKALPCDIFLAPHTGFFNLTGKAERLDHGERPNPFIDPQGYREFIARSEESFLAQLKKEKQTPNASQ